MDRLNSGPFRELLHDNLFHFGGFKFVRFCDSRMYELKAEKCESHTMHVSEAVFK